MIENERREESIRSQLQLLNVTLRRAEIERGRSGYFTKWINVFLGCVKLQILIYLVLDFIVKFLMGWENKEGQLQTLRK